MSISEAGILSLIGFLVVIVELSLLAVIIVIMSKIICAITGRRDNKNAAVSVSQSEPPKPSAIPAGMVKLPETQSAGSLDLHDVDDKTAAMLMAIVSDDSGIPLNELRFQSIKKID